MVCTTHSQFVSSGLAGFRTFGYGFVWRSCSADAHDQHINQRLQRLSALCAGPAPGRAAADCATGRVHIRSAPATHGKCEHTLVPEPHAGALFRYADLHIPAIIPLNPRHRTKAISLQLLCGSRPNICAFVA